MPCIILTMTKDLCHMQPEDGVTVVKETLLPSISNFAATSTSTSTKHAKESSRETRKKSRESSEEVKKEKDDLPPKQEQDSQVKEAALSEREAIEKKHPIGNLG